MAKATVHNSDATEPVQELTPSQQIIAAAAKTTTVVGPSGRRYNLRKLTPLVRMRIFEALGGELSQNLPFLSHALVAASVAGIDGVPEPIPTRRAQIDFMVERLEEDWEEINEALAKSFGGSSEVGDTQAIKNS